MEQHAEKLLRFFQFYGFFARTCEDCFVASMDELRARYECRVVLRHEIAQCYADKHVEDFEDSFFPRIDIHALEFFLLFSAYKAVADTLKDISATREQDKAQVTRWCREGSFLLPSEQERVKAAWGQLQVQEPDDLLRFLFSSLHRSAQAQIENWPRDWRTGAFTWNSGLLALTSKMVNGSLVKDWHKYQLWQSLEDILRDRLLPRGLTVWAASRLIELTLKHFFPKEMQVKYMARTMRDRWQREQKK